MADFDTEDARQLGELQGRMTAVEREIGEMRTDVKVIRSAVDAASGGWKLLLVMVSVAGAVGAAASWLATHLAGR